MLRLKLISPELLLVLVVIRCTRGFVLDQTSTATGQCVDSDSLDCPTVNLTSNLCSNVMIARPLCPKFCGYCNITDGHWSAWAPWSKCDVTCSNGTLIRLRTCTNPPPTKPYGKDCVGSRHEVQQCHNTVPCPIHGAWGQWSMWGSCSQTCGMGMQHRDRNCDSPYPSLNGDHCFGAPNAYRICSERACTDGGWSQWGQWSACSVTCGGGFRTRDRSCDNPTPSMLGKQCSGNPQMVAPCNAAHCPSQQVAFTAHGATGKAVNTVLTFTNVDLNAGDGYDQTTGRFTCPVAGTYLFSATLLSVSSRSGETYCWIRKNAASVALVDSYEGTYDSASVSVIFHLSVGDVVDLGSCSNVNDIDTGSGHSSFIGSLIQAD